MKISTRDKPQVFDAYAMVSYLPILRDGETLIVYQETSKMEKDKIDVYLESIASALRYLYPNNMVMVTSMVNGVKQTEFEIK